VGDNGETEELVKSPEEKLLGVYVEDIECDPMEALMQRRSERQQRRLASLQTFLGDDRTVTASVVQPVYYRRLLAWALQRYIEEQGWQTVRTVGYLAPEPLYTDVNTGSGETTNVLCDGTLFLVRLDERLAVTIDASPRGNNSVVVTGPARCEDTVRGFTAGVETTVRQRNFYRGRNIEFGGRIDFLDVPPKSWDTIVLDEEAREEIEANTTGFMARRESLARYGIPARRGVLLTGAPGTGKTLICKALMSTSRGTTCILTNAYALAADDYIPVLYELARDLAPSIVFIEDIDLIAQERMEWGYASGAALLALLAVLDGIEECHEIITVATTNHRETLDKALKQRPSRFDRIIEIPCPSPEQRRSLVAGLCRRLPLDGDIQEHIARRTAGFTPAQVQEVLYSLAIRYGEDNGGDVPQPLSVTAEQVDRTISTVGGKGKPAIGFTLGGSPIREPSQRGISVNNGNGKEAEQ